MAYEFGEGVPGECWLRGDLDWNILQPLIDDPERPYDAHLETAATLFAASLAVPIFDIVRPHHLVAVVVCYTPHELGQSSIHEYLDTRQNPELGLFMKEMSILMPLALRWMQSKVTRLEQNPSMRNNRFLCISALDHFDCNRTQTCPRRSQLRFILTGFCRSATRALELFCSGQYIDVCDTRAGFVGENISVDVGGPKAEREAKVEGPQGGGQDRVAAGV